MSDTDRLNLETAAASRTAKNQETILAGRKRFCIEFFALAVKKLCVLLICEISKILRRAFYDENDFPRNFYLLPFL
jgi:hypothetical protein